MPSSTSQKLRFNPLQVGYKHIVFEICLAVTAGFNPLQVGYKPFSECQQYIVTKVSIPYRQAINIYHNKCNKYLYQCVSIPYRQAINYDPSTNEIKGISCFNPLQVGYKQTQDGRITSRWISFNPLQVGYKLAYCNEICIVFVRFNPLQVGYKRGKWLPFVYYITFRFQSLIGRL